MPVREGMEALIEEVRDLIGDPAGEGETFTDEQLQTRLDRTLDGVEVEDAVSADFDVYTAAGDTCEAWAARLKGDVDFKHGKAEFKDHQQVQTLMELAWRLRARSTRGIGVGRLSDTDTNPGPPGGAW